MTPLQTTPETAPNLTLKRWSVDDYHRMIAAGVLTPSDRVELLNGQIIEMVPQDPPHASTTDESSDYLKTCFAGRAKVRAQLPITLAPNSEPEPDIAVVRIDERRYRDCHPIPSDVFLVIEISDSTLQFDRTHKGKIYAAANIPEYWIVNLKQQQVIVFRDPQTDGYQTTQILSAASQIAPLAFPDIVIDLQNILF